MTTRVHHYCDACGGLIATSSQAPVHHYQVTVAPVSIDGVGEGMMMWPEPTVLHLCPPCKRRVVDPLRSAGNVVGFFGEPPHDAYTIAPKETDGWPRYAGRCRS